MPEMPGWFDAFRTEGGPTLYAYSNRTAVTGDVAIITICLTFLTCFLAFVVIFPGVRKERFSTFCTVTLSLLTGMIICVCNFGSSWECTTGEIVSSYRAFSAQKINAQLGVQIGLDHANVSLRIIPRDNRSLDIDFNERFFWNTPKDMKTHYRKALQKGLPYPILTVAEYLTLDKEGFSWGRSYRNAGYYTNIFLWSAFATWLLANLLVLNVPRYGAYMMVVTGFLMGSACLAFWLLKPPMPFQMRFEDTILTFKLGWCFWMVLVVGSLVGVSGVLISIVDLIYPHKFSTILEVDFDTPYDRHIIIEDSHDTRKRRFKIPRLEEPFNAGISAGSRLLRRLSKRGKDPHSGEHVETHPGAGNGGIRGVENKAFDMDAQSTPKTPWKSSIMMRTDSKKSNKSVNFLREASLRSQGLLEIPDLPLEDRGGQPKALQRTDSKQSSLSAASILSHNTRGHHSIEDVVLSSPTPDLPSMTRQDSSQSCSSSTSSIALDNLSRTSSIKRVVAEENLHQPVSRNNSGNIIVFHRTDSRGQLQRLNGEVVEIQTDDDPSNW